MSHFSKVFFKSGPALYNKHRVFSIIEKCSIEVYNVFPVCVGDVNENSFIHLVTH